MYVNRKSLSFYHLPTTIASLCHITPEVKPHRLPELPESAFPIISPLTWHGVSLQAGLIQISRIEKHIDQNISIVSSLYSSHLVQYVQFVKLFLPHQSPDFQTSCWNQFLAGSVKDRCNKSKFIFRKVIAEESAFVDASIFASLASKIDKWSFMYF